FLYLLQEAGIKTLGANRKYLKILKPVQIAPGDKRISIYPSDHFKVSYTISFDHPLLRHQSRTERITETSFADNIAAARTFGFLKGVAWLPPTRASVAHPTRAARPRGVTPLPCQRQFPPPQDSRRGRRSGPGGVSHRRPCRRSPC